MSNAILNGSYNGLVWGPAGGDASIYCERLRGLDDLPAIVSRDAPKVLGDGLAAGEDLLGEWSVTVVLAVVPVNKTDAEFRALKDAVNAAFSRQTTPKPLRFWDLTRYVMARPRERTWSDMDAKECQHIAVCTTRLVVVDPTTYLGAPPP